MATKRFQRVRGPSEKEQREAAGLWKAIRFVRELAERKGKITLELILDIHRIFLGEVYPESAGRFRRAGEDVKKLKYVEPPPGRLVEQKMYIFWREFDAKISVISLRQPASKTGKEKWFEKVLELAVWAQHQIGAIHPFSEGNGRTARLLTNLVLERFGIKPSQLKYEGEKREEYLNALCQADRFGVYESLKRIVLESVREVYQREENLRKRVKRANKAGI